MVLRTFNRRGSVDLSVKERAGPGLGDDKEEMGLQRSAKSVSSVKARPNLEFLSKNEDGSALYSSRNGGPRLNNSGRPSPTRFHRATIDGVTQSRPSGTTDALPSPSLSSPGGARKVRFGGGGGPESSGASGSGGAAPASQRDADRFTLPPLSHLRRQSETGNNLRRQSETGKKSGGYGGSGLTPTTPRGGLGGGGEPAPTSGEGSKGSNYLRWQGEPPHRFTVLSGSQVVKEGDLSIIFNMYTECLTQGGGELTVDAIKAYASKIDMKRNLNTAKLATSICQVLMKSRDSRRTPLSLVSMLEATYPRSLREELEFLSLSAAQMRFQGMGGDVVMRALTLEEMRMATQVYDLLDKNDNGYVSVATLMKEIIASFGDLEEYILQKQLRKVLPGAFTSVDPEKFQQFLAVHLAAVPCLDLSQWCSVLTGADVVVGRYVHREEYMTDKEIMHEIRGAKPKSGIGKLFRALSGKKHHP